MTHYSNSVQPGTWMWETRNTTVNWFDWGDGEPNNFNGQVKRDMYILRHDGASVYR